MSPNPSRLGAVLVVFYPKSRPDCEKESNKKKLTSSNSSTFRKFLTPVEFDNKFKENRTIEKQSSYVLTTVLDRMHNADKLQPIEIEFDNFAISSGTQQTVLTTLFSHGWKANFGTRNRGRDAYIIVYAR